MHKATCGNQLSVKTMQLATEGQRLTSVNVTRYWENDPNLTSVKIKLTPPMDSYTTILPVQTLSIIQTTEGWF